jgi:tRNA (cmo5U34)-methyltransferase
MSHFDSAAVDWDKNNVNTLRSEAIAKQLKEMKLLKPGMKAMEFGAGTALLSFILKDHFSSVTLIDSSQEMIRVCNEKIAINKTSHFKAIKIDLETEHFEDNFDIIYSQMVFHHIIDIGKMIQKFYHLLEESGFLAIADLYAEDGTFHSEGFTGHKGFDPEWLSNVMQKSGFVDISYKPCYVQKKLHADGILKEYPVFLMVARKFSEKSHK